MPLDLPDLTDVDPFVGYERIAAAGPVQWDEQMDAWVISRFAECSSIARREAVFETPWRHAVSGADVLGRYGLYILRGEEHRTVHHGLRRWFEANAGEATRTMIARHFDELVDGMPDASSFECCEALLEPIVGRVILDVLGFPVTEALRLRLVELNESLRQWFASFGDDPDVLDDCLQAIKTAEDLMLPVIRVRGTAPTGDLLSAIWEVGRAQFDDWDERDVAKYATFMFGAGTVNSANLMASVIYVILTTPGLCAELATSAERIPALVEEVTRLWSPVQLRVRRAANDVELAGTLIRAGDRVHPLIAAANRDPERFERPNELDPDRQRLKAHMGFYLGARYCAGAELARIEAAQVARSFLDRFPNARLDADRPPPRFRGFSYRGFRPLYVQTGQQLV